MTENNRTEALRTFFAKYVITQGRANDPRLEQAFASIPREQFVPPGPWSICVPGVGYIRTPNDDPAFLYQDTLVALDADRGINIGQPSGHAHWLDALALREGETVVQVGAGTGYYTTILARLVGPEGKVHAYEIDATLAAIAAKNVSSLANVSLHAVSGVDSSLPETDAIYVNAAATHPAPAWLAALKIGGRLMFPLHAAGGFGGMLHITKGASATKWPARFVSHAGFIPCVGGQDEATGRQLAEAFRKGSIDAVKSFRLGDAIDEACWFASPGWSLSKESPDK